MSKGASQFRDFDEIALTSETDYLKKKHLQGQTLREKILIVSVFGEKFKVRLLVSESNLRLVRDKKVLLRAGLEMTVVSVDKPIYVWGDGAFVINVEDNSYLANLSDNDLDYGSNLSAIDVGQKINLGSRIQAEEIPTEVIDNTELPSGESIRRRREYKGEV